MKTDAVNRGHGVAVVTETIASEALVEQVQIGFDGKRRRATSGIVHDGQYIWQGGCQGGRDEGIADGGGKGKGH